jgi:hypothetical protein
MDKLRKNFDGRPGNSGQSVEMDKLEQKWGASAHPHRLPLLFCLLSIPIFQHGSQDPSKSIPNCNGNNGLGVLSCPKGDGSLG